MAATTSVSRPLRAFGIVIGLWIGGRALALWSAMPVALIPPTGAVPRSPVALAAALSPIQPDRLAFATNPEPSVERAFASRKSIADDTADLPARSRQSVKAVVALSTSHTIPAAPKPATTMPGAIPAAAQLPTDAGRAQTPDRWVVPTTVASVTGASRFSGSAWLLQRGGGNANSLVPAGELGGSQFGARLNYALTRAVFVTSRISSPLASRSGAEATVGLGIRHGAVGLIVEQRFGLDGARRSATSVTAYGGVSDVALPASFRLDGYGQAGLVDRAGFADGALRIERTILTQGQLRLSAGAGLWGAVQPHLSRLDIGPQIVGRLPVIGRTIRLSAEWRARVAGNASPANGPAITLGTDF